MAEYSINIDDWQDERWLMTGRDLMLRQMEEKGTEEHKEALRRAKDCSCGLEDVIYEFADEHIPMMNYAYPLEIEPSEDAILEVCKETSCTVVEDNNTGEYFLALCGGGMDLSQDIALAFTIAQKWLPISLLSSVSTQSGLSKSGDKFQRIKDIIIEQAEMEAGRFKELAKRWKAIEVK